jgi:hypothetical protein
MGKHGGHVIVDIVAQNVALKALKVKTKIIRLSYIIRILKVFKTLSSLSQNAERES